MKTKFSELLKVKKRKVDEVENRLLDFRNQKNRVYLQIEEIDRDISSLKIPKSGDFTKITLSYAHLSNLSNQKKLKIEETLSLEAQIEVEKELYKKANIDFEKIKYLDNLEIKKVLLQMKIQESKDMDEIANILFSNKKNMAIL